MNSSQPGLGKESTPFKLPFETISLEVLITIPTFTKIKFNYPSFYNPYIMIRYFKCCTETSLQSVI